MRAHLIERGKEEERSSRRRSASEDKEEKKREAGVPHGSEIEIRDVDGMEYREKGRRRATCLPDCSVGYVKLLENVGVPRINDERERTRVARPGNEIP